MSGTERKSRVLVVGFDGAPFEIIDPLLAKGLLPNTRRLIEEGVRGDLQSSHFPKTPQAWSCFLTGLNPGKHGIYGFARVRPGSYRIEYVNGSMREGKTLFRLASDAGRRIAALNVPMTYPPEEVEGQLVTGILTPSKRSAFTHPPDLLERLEEACGEYTIFPDLPGGISDEEYLDRWRSDLLEVMRARGRAARWMLEQEPWDLFSVVFAATDQVGHDYFRAWDPDHPEYTPELAERHGDAIDEIYQAADEELGRLLEMVDLEQTTVFLISDHGMQAVHRVVYLTNWLVSQGFLHYRKRAPMARLFKGLKRFMWRRLPIRWVQGLSKMLPGWLRNRAVESLVLSGIDWSKTKAFAVGYGGAIYLNTSDRPQGVVSPDEVAAVRQDITDRLLAFEDESGRSLVEQVYTREELFKGPYLGHAPDLLPKWARNVRNVLSPGANPETLVAPLDATTRLAERQSGAHSMEGILVARGADLKRQATVEGARLMDMAPTILYQMGLEIPGTMDGRVLTELYRAGVLAERPVQQGPADESAGSGPPAEQAFRPDEEEAIEERLRSLGYL